MTHLLAYLAGIVTAVLLLWSWVGCELMRAGCDEQALVDDGAE